MPSATSIAGWCVHDGTWIPAGEKYGCLSARGIEIEVTGAILKRQLSHVSLALFNMAGLNPGEVDEALDTLVKAGRSVILRIQHPLVQRVTQASGVRVVQVARRSRCLLLTLAPADSNTPAWVYREESPRRCVFSCAGTVPQTAQVALAGAALGLLVEPHMALDQVAITEVGEAGDGWLVLFLKPTWHAF